MHAALDSWWRKVNLSETCRILYQNKFEKWCILLAFIIKIYHDARSSECQSVTIDSFQKTLLHHISTRTIVLLPIIITNILQFMLPTLFTPSPRWGTGHRGGTWIPETSAQDSTSEMQSAMPADSFVTTWGSNTKFICKTLRSLPLLQHGCSYYHSTFQEFWWPKVCRIQNSLRAVLEFFVLPKTYCSQQISNLNLQALPQALVPFPMQNLTTESAEMEICWRGSSCKLLILSFQGDFRSAEISVVT